MKTPPGPLSDNIDNMQVVGTQRLLGTCSECISDSAGFGELSEFLCSIAVVPFLWENPQLQNLDFLCLLISSVNVLSNIYWRYFNTKVSIMEIFLTKWQGAFSKVTELGLGWVGLSFDLIVNLIIDLIINLMVKYIVQKYHVIHSLGAGGPRCSEHKSCYVPNSTCTILDHPTPVRDMPLTALHIF